MPVKIRLARRGRRKNPYYHIVVADARAPRDGKFIENIGSYNPMTSPATIELDQDRALEWMMKGAQPTDTARAILRFRGVLYKKHLMRGVAKGAFSEEKAEQMFKEWIDAKDSKIAERILQAAEEKKARWNAISGKPGAMPVVASADADAAQAFTTESDAPETVTETAAVVEEPAAPVAEEPTPEAEVAEAVVEDAAAPVEEAAAPVEEASAPAAEEAAEEPAVVAEESPAPATEEAPSPASDDAAPAEEKVDGE